MYRVDCISFSGIALKNEGGTGKNKALASFFLCSYMIWPEEVRYIRRIKTEKAYTLGLFVWYYPTQQRGPSSYGHFSSLSHFYEPGQTRRWWRQWVTHEYSSSDFSFFLLSPKKSFIIRDTHSLTAHPHCYWSAWDLINTSTKDPPDCPLHHHHHHHHIARCSNTRHSLLKRKRYSR